MGEDRPEREKREVERAALTDELNRLRSASEEEIKRLTTVKGQMRTAYRNETAALLKENERLGQTDREVRVEDLKPLAPTEEQLLSRIADLEIAFVDHCEETSDLERRLEALHAHRAKLEETVVDLKEQLPQESARFHRKQERVMNIISTLTATLQEKERETLELERRDRELTAENEKIATQIAADVRKNAKTIANVKKCLEVHRSALKQSIRGEKHFQARVADQHKVEPLPFNPAQVVQKGSNNVQRWTAASLPLSEADASVASPATSVSSPPCPRTTNDLLDLVDGEQNHMILRLFKRLTAEWFRPEAQKKLSQGQLARATGTTVSMAADASKALEARIPPKFLGTTIDSAPALVQFKVPARSVVAQGARVRLHPGLRTPSHTVAEAPVLAGLSLR